MKYWLVALLILAGCGGSSNSPAPPTQPGISGWTAFYSPNTVLSNGSFDFPGQDGVHYVVAPATASLGQAVTLTFQITGSGTFGISGADTPPATVHLFLWERGDNMSGSGAYETYREWCGRTVLGVGTFTVTCKLDPSQWTGVFGQTPSAAAFSQMLSNLYAAGFTFGGASFAGHGIYAATGSLHFQLIGFSIQ